MWFLAFTQFVSEWALTLLLAFICVAISSLAGLAGGILVLPILLFVKGEQPTVAVGLKSVALFGGALVNLMHHMGERHPLSASRPLIDWSFIIAAVPSAMLGARIGGFINKHLPSHITLPLLTCVLFISAYETQKKANALDKKMKRANASIQTSPEPSEPSPETAIEARLLGDAPEAAPRSPGGLKPRQPHDLRLDVDITEVTAGADSPVPAAEAAAAAARELHSIRGPAPASDFERNSAAPAMQTDNNPAAAAPKSPAPPAPVIQVQAAAGLARPSGATNGALSQPSHAHVSYPPLPEPLFMFRNDRVQPMKEIGIMTGLTFVLVTLDLLEKHAKCGSAIFWIFEAVAIFSILAVMLWANGRLHEISHELKSEGQTPLDGDIVWSTRNASRVPIIFVFFGLLTGALGGGGGVVQTPVMLSLNMRPDVTRATSLTMIFFVSIASVSIYFSMGVLPVGLSIVFGLIGLSGTEFAQFGMRHLSMLNGEARKVQLVRLMAALIGTGAVLTGVRALMEGDSVEDGLVPLWAFTKMCRDISGGDS